MTTSSNFLSNLALAIILFPLLGCLIAGFFGKKIGQRGAHWVTTLMVGASFFLSIYLVKLVVFDNLTFNGAIYTWGSSGNFVFDVGFLIDRLSALMMLTVTFVSFLVHIYSIGYMKGDPGYQRFFSYISLFTFAMLMLVSANNFMQLYFGWEGVGLVSYLLIGFWYKKNSANEGGLKAFLINRVGDLGFILGIGAILAFFGSVDYATVFSQAPALAASNAMVNIYPHIHWSAITVICLLLFIGAMGKSAQMPLHVWLPESMEGPTPISALIHAATMVTAGVYMVARMSPLFELSPVSLSVILIIGGTSALFTGILALVQNDIKRVVAYSTLSQLGYMMAALGASAFSAGIFHLFTHACFKALLFLAAGSVIIGMHHEQDMRKMGNLRKYMPITYVTFLIGALALCAIPPFAGFYSKDTIIDAVHLSTVFGGTYAYYCVLIGTFVTALYTFRAFFMTFHTEERMDQHTRETIKESSAVVWIPLLVLAVPSIILGWVLEGPMLENLFGNAIYTASQYDTLSTIASDFHGSWAMMLHAVFTLPFWLAIAGVFCAWFAYVCRPQLPAVLAQRFSTLYTVLVHKYGFDEFNNWFFVKGGIRFANWLFRVGDIKILDDLMVNGSGRVVAWLSAAARKLQTGYLYHYVLAMVLGVLVFGVWYS
ncbi:MAG: NADH-quinone oxidoreductase subunit L [Legionellales bacterium]|nr:NADH-quinone oxidoreductase subunit L [Legionellales bacterium]